MCKLCIGKIKEKKMVWAISLSASIHANFKVIIIEILVLIK